MVILAVFKVNSVPESLIVLLPRHTQNSLAKL